MHARREFVMALGAGAIAAQLPGAALAQTYPAKPVRFIFTSTADRHLHDRGRQRCKN